jgi:hypothetical protein
MGKTRDRGYFAPEKLGPKQSLTPEGYLLCESVPVARTGVFLYHESELKGEDGPIIKGDADGGVAIERTAEELFSPISIASFEGKPVTIDHPDDFVNPSNWKVLTVGVMQNVRRGEGIEDDLMLADLLITDAMAIEEVRRALPEVSNGYEADYEQLGPGKGRQLNIVGNHVALVERGRCGPRCAIGDKAMSKKKSPIWVDRLMRAFKAKDEAAFETELEEAQTMMGDESKEREDNHDFNALVQRIDKIEGILAKLVPVENAEHGEQFDEQGGNEPAKEDEEAEREKVGDTIARAEILCPGIKTPTGDSIKAKSMDSLKRKAIDGAPEEIRKLFGDVSKLNGKALDAAFVGASELAKAKNNAAGIRHNVTDRDFGRNSTPADINALYRAARNRK